MAGLTAEGLVVETFETLRAKVHARLRNEFGPIPLDESTLEGLITDIFVEAMVKLWEIAETCYSALDIDKAVGQALDALTALVGVFRRPATFSIGTSIVLTGDVGTVVPAGTQLSTGASGTVVELLADSDAMVAAPARAISTAYALGDIVTNAGHIYRADNAGTTGTGTGPTHTTREGAGMLDGVVGGVFWTWLGEGTAYVDDVRARATEEGATSVPAYAITDIETPFLGLRGGTNILDFNAGEDQMTDEELREAREAQLAQPGTGTNPAIGAALRIVDGVISATVFSNRSSTTDADGVPPHSVEALVRGGEDQDIWDALYANVADGIGFHGDEVGSVTDSEGTVHTVRFSRPEELAVYLRVVLTKNPAEYAGDAVVEEEIVEFGDDVDTGRDVEPSEISSVAFDVDGVLRVSEVMAYTDVISAPTAWAPSTAYVATPGARSVVTNNDRTYICVASGVSAASGGPVGTGAAIVDGTCQWYFLGRPIEVSRRQLAVYDTTRIAVVSTDGVP